MLVRGAGVNWNTDTRTLTNRHNSTCTEIQPHRGGKTFPQTSIHLSHLAVIDEAGEGLEDQSIRSRRADSFRTVGMIGIRMKSVVVLCNDDELDTGRADGREQFEQTPQKRTSARSLSGMPRSLSHFTQKLPLPCVHVGRETVGGEARPGPGRRFDERNNAV